MKRRVVITGLGMITPLGVDVESCWSALLAGRSGIGRVTRFDPGPHETQIAGEVRDFDAADYLPRKEARHLDRYAQFAIVAAEMALKHSGLQQDRVDRDRTGVIMGTGIGGIETYCNQYDIFMSRGPGRVSPFFIPMMIANMAAGQIAIRYGFRGPNSTVVTACASSAHAVLESTAIIARGHADVMLAGGSEAAIVPVTFAGFNAMGALSRRNDEPEQACRPFDEGRDGFVMAEGAAVLVLESYEHARARDAHIYAEVLGAGMSADAYHIVETAPDGTGAVLAMQRALTDAGLQPHDIQYINAHATSTGKGDISETMAIRSVFGAYAADVSISATKSMTGHLLGAAGATELIISILALRSGRIPPTINLEHPDPTLADLDLTPNVAAEREIQHALSNSFGFGGHNVSLIIGRANT